MSRPTLSDLSPRAQEEARAQILRLPHPKTVAVGAMLPLREVKVASKTCRKAPKLDYTAIFAGCCSTPPFAEFRFHPVRKWRFDLAWPHVMLAVEIDGGLFINGGHSRGAQREKDYEKDAHALIAGWRVLRVSTGQMRSGQAVEWVKAIIAPKPLQGVPTLLPDDAQERRENLT